MNLTEGQLLFRLQDFHGAEQEALGIGDYEFAQESADIASALRELLQARRKIEEITVVVGQRNGECVRLHSLLESAEKRIAELEARHITLELPMQPLAFDSRGTLRFKENHIVRKLLDFSTAHGYGLNEMALEDFTSDDRMQLAQLIGYSLTGYGELSYVTDESYDRAAAAAPQQEPLSESEPRARIEATGITIKGINDEA